MHGTAIELDGKVVGWVSDVVVGTQPIGAIGARGEGVSGRGPIRASYAIAEAGPLLDWILAGARGQAITATGGLIVVEDGVQKRRCDWTIGHVTSVKFPKFTASEGKKPFMVDFKWQPSTIEYSKGSGKAAPPPARDGGWTTGDFRFQGLPGDTDYLSGIVLPTITVAKAEAKKGGVQLGDLTLELEGADRDALFAYAQKVIKDGKLTEGEYLDFGIEMLDPSTGKAAGKIALPGARLLATEEVARQKGGKATIKLKFSVEQIDLKLSM